MKITLETFANIREVIGSGRLNVELPDGSVLADLFSALASRHGAAFERQVRDQTTGQLVPFLILVNGRSFRSTVDMALSLNDGDAVCIMIPFDGG